VLILLFSTNVLFSQSTLLKGKTINWATDSIYITHLTFHSPYSSHVEKTKLSKDGTFEFAWKQVKHPFIIAISPSEKYSKLLSDNLLYENCTKDYFYGQCIKFFKSGNNVFLLEPNQKLDIALTANTWIDTLSDKKAAYFRNLGVEVGEGNTVRNYGTTKITFLGDADNVNNNYFQEMLYKRTLFDEVVESAVKNNNEMTLAKLLAVEKNLLEELAQKAKNMTPVFRDYIKTEYLFSMKMEFLKHLQLEDTAYLKSIIHKEKDYLDLFKMLVFDPYALNETQIRSEMYNEYLEFYLNFMMNLTSKEYLDYQPFSLKKIQLASQELPQTSFYYYTANRLIHHDNGFGVAKRLMAKFPNGALNDNLTHLKN
jgi:hypothetical protein